MTTSVQTEARQGLTSRRALFLLSLAQLLGFVLVFAGTAVIPQITTLWHSGLALASWLTIAVQIGFSLGAITFALFNIPDVFSPIKVLVVSAVAAAAANAAFAFVAADPLPAILLRGATGFFLAGVYPVGMKIIAGWFQRGRGLALGVMIGALTVGSALPHAVNALGRVPWQGVVLLGSAQALLGALVVALGVREGPYAMPKSVFDPAQILEIVRNRPLRLANLGYLGHMWELYSMWGWIAVIFSVSAGWSRSKFEAMAALAIAVGAVGCIWAGVASDKLQDQAANMRVAQRARVTIIAMAVSSVCCVGAALALHQPAILIPLSLIWGIAIIADSAQFSTIISEVSDKNYVGTALTCQVALGFLLTAAMIRLMAEIAAHSNWQWALASMAIGPLLGIWAMSGLLPRKQVR